MKDHAALNPGREHQIGLAILEITDDDHVVTVVRALCTVLCTEILALELDGHAQNCVRIIKHLDKVEEFVLRHAPEE